MRDAGARFVPADLQDQVPGLIRAHVESVWRLSSRCRQGWRARPPPPRRATRPVPWSHDSPPSQIEALSPPPAAVVFLGDVIHNGYHSHDFEWCVPWCLGSGRRERGAIAPPAGTRVLLLLLT